MLRALEKLVRIGFLTPRGLWGFARAVRAQGPGPMALLAYAARRHPDRMAIRDDREAVTYGQLHASCQNLAHSLEHLEAGAKVALLGSNQIAMVQALLALSKLGVDAYLLNVEMAPAQLVALLESRPFDLVWCDLELKTRLEAAGCKVALADLPPLCQAGLTSARKGNGRIAVMTGGTSGKAKSSSRKPSIAKLVRPFCGLLEGLNLEECKSVYIATAFYHGYGLAFLFVAFLMGSQVHIAKKFKAEEAVARIREHGVEALVVVPLMLQRMLGEGLGSLKCIVAGGARLDAALVRQVQQNLSARLHNLYGSTEAGFSILATPEDLARRPEALGRAIPGVKIQIQTPGGQVVPAGERGVICVRSPWSVAGDSVWVSTGDLGAMDADGYVVLLGRADDMIVSGGENVFPDDVQIVLARHPAIEAVVVLGVPDAEFGQRLCAFVVLNAGQPVDELELQEWSRSRLARFQMPRFRFVAEIPTTATGKVDRARLLAGLDKAQ